MTRSPIRIVTGTSMAGEVTNARQPRVSSSADLSDCTLPAASPETGRIGSRDMSTRARTRTKPKLP